MKEKEVDVCLSLAALGHFILVGVGGGFVTELFTENPRFEIMYGSAFILVLVTVVLILIYSQVFNNIKNKK